MNTAQRRICANLAKSFQTEEDLGYDRRHVAAAAAEIGREDATFSDRCCRCKSHGRLWEPLTDPDGEYLCGRCVLAEWSGIETPSAETLGQCADQ